MLAGAVLLFLLLTLTFDRLFVFQYIPHIDHGSIYKLLLLQTLLLQPWCRPSSTEMGRSFGCQKTRPNVCTPILVERYFAIVFFSILTLAWGVWLRWARPPGSGWRVGRPPWRWRTARCRSTGPSSAAPPWSGRRRRARRRTRRWRWGRRRRSGRGRCGAWWRGGWDGRTAPTRPGTTAASWTWRTVGGRRTQPRTQRFWRR